MGKIFSSPNISKYLKFESELILISTKLLISKGLIRSIISISVERGDQVITGDEICVLESMKMQQSLRADWSGIVKTVHVQAGQQVLDGDPIVDLE